MPDAYAKFGDQRVGYGFSYTLSWGTQPGIARITCPPFAGDFRGVDNLDVFLRGDRFFRLRQARFANPSSPSGTTSAPTVERLIEDRRWKWQFGAPLFGNFNEELPTGKLLRERSPRDLAALCFEALGDGGSNVDALPTDPRPRLIWEAARPVDELERLCSNFGCAVAYDPFNDRAYLVKIGDGSAPPGGVHSSRSDGLLIPASPDNTRVVMGPTLYQMAIELTEAVGLDVDGKYHAINSLSYTPTVLGVKGWSKLLPKQFEGLTSQYDDLATGEKLYHRDLAAQSVWRAYRFAIPVPQALKGSQDAPNSLKDVGPFLGTRLDKDPLTGERMPIMVRGVFADSRKGFANSKPKTRFPGSVSINQELRIATFSEPLFKFSDDAQSILPADVELIAAFNVTNEGVPIRGSLEQATGLPFASGEHVEYHDEIVTEIIEKTASLNGVAQTNVAKTKKEAQYYLDALASRFRESQAASITYNGLRKFTLDGALRTVSWGFSTTSAPTTSASWNAENNPYVLPYEQRGSARAQRQADYANRRAVGQSRVIASKISAARATT